MQSALRITIRYLSRSNWRDSDQLLRLNAMLSILSVMHPHRSIPHRFWFEAQSWLVVLSFDRGDTIHAQATFIVQCRGEAFSLLRRLQTRYVGYIH